MARIVRAAGAVLLALTTVLAATTVDAAADEPVPTPLLTTPPAGLRGHALWDSFFDLAPFGYEEEELFVTGTAVDAGGVAAPYTTRIIVTRPTDPSRFNGTVLLDWVNVTAQFENAVDSILARPMLMREGFAFVHMSAQSAGLCCLPALTPKLWDPVRYAAISHPGDGWSFDIVTQIAQAFRQAPPLGGRDPMGSLGVGRVRNVLAAGQSQSGIRLYDYLNGWLPSHPAAVGIIDGVLVHGDVGQPKTFAQSLPIPVLKLLSDFEAVDDGVDPATLDPNLRLWEIAGAAHADYWIGYQSVFGHGPRVTVDAPPIGPAAYADLLWAAGNYGEQITPLLATCIVAGAAMPMHAATSAAIHRLTTWVDGGDAPPHGPRFAFSGGALARDQHGNALGGIRLPPMDVPVASYQSTTCALGGLTIPFTDLQLAQMYGSHASYLQQMADRSNAAVTAGWLLPDDAVTLMARACAARNRFPVSSAPCPAYVPPAFAVPLAAPVPETGPPPTTEPAGGTLPATGPSGWPVAVAGPLLVAALLLWRVAGDRRGRARRDAT